MQAVDKQEYLQRWNSHLDDFHRLFWAIRDPNKREELLSLIKTLRCFIAIAAENEFTD